MAMMTPSKARFLLTGSTVVKPGPYYAVGVEVTPRRDARFSMRYIRVGSAREGRKLLRRRIINKKVGMIGELVLFSQSGEFKVVLQSIVRRANREIEVHDDSRGREFPSSRRGNVRRVNPRRTAAPRRSSR